MGALIFLKDLSAFVYQRLNCLDIVAYHTSLLGRKKAEIIIDHARKIYLLLSASF